MVTIVRHIHPDDAIEKHLGQSNCFKAGCEKSKKKKILSLIESFTSYKKDKYKISFWVNLVRDVTFECDSLGNRSMYRNLLRAPFSLKKKRNIQKIE